MVMKKLNNVTRRGIESVHFFLDLPLSVQIPTILFVIGIVGSFFYYVFNEGAITRRPAPSVEIAKVRKAALSESATVIGTLEANQMVVLRSQVNGTIEQIHFKGGQSVEKDAPLITLDDKVFKANLLDAEAQLKTTKADFERVEKLAKNNAFASQKAKEQAEAKYRQAEAKYEVSKHQYENTVIRAPFSGTVGLRQEAISIGTLVDQRQELLRIVDVDPIRIRFSVPARIAMKLHPGQKIHFNVDGHGKKKMAAKIDSIDAQVNKATNSLSMYAKAPNPHGILRAGLFGRVMLLAGTREGAIVVPEVAVDMTGDEKFVYRIVPIVTKGKKRYLAEKVVVTTGLRNGAEIEIASGLRPNDHIIVVGTMKFGGIPRSYANPVNIEDFPDLEKQIVDVDEVVRKQKQKSVETEERLKGVHTPEDAVEPSDEEESEEEEDEEDEIEEEDDEETQARPSDKSAVKTSAAETVKAQKSKTLEKTDVSANSDNESVTSKDSDAKDTKSVDSPSSVKSSDSSSEKSTSQVGEETSTKESTGEKPSPSNDEDSKDKTVAV